MGMPGVVGRRSRGGQRTRPPFRSPLAARRSAKERSRSPASRQEWTSFVARCLRSWEQARASATEFLAVWTPLYLPEPLPALTAPPDRARRKASRVGRAGASARTAQHPAPLVGTSSWTVPIEAAGGVETLRERYPLVTALLIELAALSRRGTVAPPTQQRG